MQGIPVAIIVRASTSRQVTERQEQELRSVAAIKGWEVVAVIHETISGRASADERKGLILAEELAEQGKIQKVLVHEVSRLGRRNSVVHSFIERLDALGVSLYWHSQSFETLLPNGKRNPAAGIMLAVLAELARAEVEQLRERVVSGMEAARKKGIHLGRPKGSTESREAKETKHKDILKCLRQGQSLRNTAKITGKSLATVKRIKSASYLN
jgi:DNA invertase Pin-like site-specific DNA recombinase